MIPEQMAFRDYAAATALETYLELFTSRHHLLGAYCFTKEMVSQAYLIGDAMESQKTDDPVINFMAVRVMRGFIIGNYNNEYREMRMSGLGVNIIPLSKKCFKIAGMMIEKRDEKKKEAQNDEKDEETAS